MAISNPSPKLNEADRRDPGAVGTPIRLADGGQWLLARPVFSAGRDSLTRPRVDSIVDRLFEDVSAAETVALQDVFQIASHLLRENYDLDDAELAELLTFDSGQECRDFVDSVVEAIFGSEEDARTYTDWVRASLLANGLQTLEIPAGDLPNVLTILVATNRTVPAVEFIDSCRLADELAHLESLV